MVVHDIPRLAVYTNKGSAAEGDSFETDLEAGLSSTGTGNCNWGGDKCARYVACSSSIWLRVDMQVVDVDIIVLSCNGPNILMSRTYTPVIWDPLRAMQTGNRPAVRPFVDTCDLRGRCHMAIWPASRLNGTGGRREIIRDRPNGVWMTRNETEIKKKKKNER